MRRFVLLLLLLLFYCFIGSQNDAYAHQSKAHSRAWAAKYLQKTPPAENAAILKQQAPADTRDGGIYLAAVDNEDEDNTYRKHLVLVRSIAFFYAYLFNHDAEAFANHFPYWQHQTSTGSPRYIRLRVIRI